MLTAKVFENGRSQAVRIPKEYRFDEEEVSISKVGDIVLLFPKDDSWASFSSAIEMFSDDFMHSGRNQGIQERENI